LKQKIKDTKRNDFNLDARRAQAYGLIDAIVESAEGRIATHAPPPAPTPPSSSSPPPLSEPVVTPEAASGN
jgi:hypothetical protein